MENKGNGKKIFICYSRQDTVWLKRVVESLNALGLQDRLKPWSDQDIPVGKNWREAIEQSLKEAHAAVFLVSTPFLASRFITETEIPRLFERHEKEGVLLFPIIIRPCSWERVSPLKDLQAVMLNDRKALSEGGESDIDKNLSYAAEMIADSLKKHQPWGVPVQKEPFALPPDSLHISLSRLPRTHPELFGREQELELLTRAASDNQTFVLALIAPGGTGKSSLINYWLQEASAKGYYLAQRVFGWSFYSQGAEEGKQSSADFFFHETLAWFGDPDPGAGSPVDKGRRLAGLIRQQPVLFILDGLEPLQYPPHELNGFDGLLKDQGLKILLRELASAPQQGLCLISSRLPLTDLTAFAGRSYREICLENLGEAAGVCLLRSRDVWGAQRDLKAAVAETNGHALALRLLGGMSKRFTREISVSGTKSPRC